MIATSTVPSKWKYVALCTQHMREQLNSTMNRVFKSMFDQAQLIKTFEKLMDLQIFKVFYSQYLELKIKGHVYSIIIYVKENRLRIIIMVYF